jgi:hypothetical protein
MRIELNNTARLNRLYLLSSLRLSHLLVQCHTKLDLVMESFLLIESKNKAIPISGLGVV